MMNCIDCFIPWQSDEQVGGTLESLQAALNVQSVNFLRKDSPSSTDTIKCIAETAMAPYTFYIRSTTRGRADRQFDYVTPKTATGRKRWSRLIRVIYGH